MKEGLYGSWEGRGRGLELLGHVGGWVRLVMRRLVLDRVVL